MNYIILIILFYFLFWKYNATITKDYNKHQRYNVLLAWSGQEEEPSFILKDYKLLNEQCNKMFLVD